MIKVTSNIDKFLKGLAAFQKDIPYIEKTYLNNLAFDIQQAVKSEIEGKLRIETKSLSTLRIIKATKEKPFAKLFHDGWQEYALGHHFKGGDRARKGLEYAMRLKGHIEEDEILTPPSKVRIKGYVYTQIMSQLKLHWKQGYDANETKRSRKRSKTTARFFLITGKSLSRLSPGVYARMPGHRAPICILRIAKKPQYKKRMDLQETADKVMDRRGGFHYQEAMKRALENRLKGFK
jgi:hypothetical protein